MSFLHEILHTPKILEHLWFFKFFASYFSWNSLFIRANEFGHEKQFPNVLLIIDKSRRRMQVHRFSSNSTTTIIENNNIFFLQIRNAADHFIDRGKRKYRVLLIVAHAGVPKSVSWAPARAASHCTKHLAHRLCGNRLPNLHDKNASEPACSMNESSLKQRRTSPLE